MLTNRRTEIRLGVRQAIRRLRVTLREVLQLRYGRNLSRREVGRRMGMSRMQVCRLEREALNELRREFTPA